MATLHSVRRPTALLVGVVLAIGIGAGCSSDGGSANTVVVYSGRNQELVEPLFEQFTRDTGIEVEARYGDSSDLALLIDEEGEQSPADVFFSQSPGSTGYLDAKGRLQPIAPAVLDSVPVRFQAKDGAWVGVSGRVRVVVYDPAVTSADELPDSIFDVTGPSYRDVLGVAPTNASFQDFVTAMRELEGEARTTQWLSDLVANGVHTYPNNIAIVQAVDRGEIKFGLVNDYYLYELRAQDPDIAADNYYFTTGDQLGSLILSTTVGVLDSAQHPETAEKFIRYLHTKKAQRYFADEAFEYPLVPGVERAPGKPPLDSIDSPLIDLSSLGDGLLKTRQLIAASGLEQS